MNIPPLVVAIATRDRPELLVRTLRSLAKCQFPRTLAEVVVAENGAEQPCESLVRAARLPLPLRFRHFAQRGKNRALNAVVRAWPDAFVVFLDDDVRVHPRVLLEYAAAVAEHPRGVFFGGRCEVDYQVPPPPWIARYLPGSARGWSRDERRCGIERAMGFNWAASAADILDAGGFDATRGPGMSHSIGDETEMQARLIAFGCRGIYLHEALVWHYVPENRCSIEWVIRRSRQYGIAKGLQLADWPATARRRFARSCRTRARALAIVARLASPLLNERLSCHLEAARQWKLGVLAGLGMRADGGGPGTND